MPLDPITINYIKQGHLVIAEGEHVRRGTFFERIVHIFSWGNNEEQNQLIANALIKHLASAKGTTHYQESLEAATHFVKATKNVNEVFQKLENVILGHKYHQILSIPIHYLIQQDGSTSNKLLSFMHNNHLHYVIKRAHEHSKETAILCKGTEIFIRSKIGKNFLETSQDIHHILEVLPASHADRPLLEALKKIIEDPTAEKSSVAEIKEKLESSHYTYMNLRDVKTDEKGIMVTQAYLGDGIEDHEISKWEDAKTTFIEKSEKAVYKVRIVTRLPEYALVKSWGQFIYSFSKNFFNYKAHGHSWIEMVEPFYSKARQFTNLQKVTCVGYFLSKKFQNADPMAYLPLPKEQVVVDEIEINQEQFEKGRVYLNEVQKLLLNPQTTLKPQPAHPHLQEADIEQIQTLYKTTIKSTCVAFTNAFREAITGIERDDREGFRKWLFPKKRFKILDRLDKLFDQTYILQLLIKPFSFLHRMELPFFKKKKDCECK